MLICQNNSETVGDLEHPVSTVYVIFLRIFREDITAAVTRIGNIASALLITASDDLLIVQNVGEHQIEGQHASSSDSDALANTAIKHEATLALILAAYVVGSVFIDPVGK